MNKRKYGQYFTKAQAWLHPHINDFIRSSGCLIAYDPFAGGGDLLRCSSLYGIDQVIGLDIDPNLAWQYNDSLKDIPHIEDAIIITNPPYLTSYSARRQKLDEGLNQYFKRYTDTYQLALENMLNAQDYVVAIVPETFLNSGVFELFCPRLVSITVLTEKLFDDTENPVCIVCFDGMKKDKQAIQCYIDARPIMDYATLSSYRKVPHKQIPIMFNAKHGTIALRAVDMQISNKKIGFFKKENLAYDYEQNIKVSSRLITLIDIEIPNKEIDEFINRCNLKIMAYRKATYDLLLSPFKGNNKEGIRRRRLDYKTARAIMEEVVSEMGKENLL